jgi:3-methyladenine DNA glycosylase/8-oxoguanine DNA glycosylase
LPRAERADRETRTNRLNSVRADTTPKTITSSPTVQQLQPAGRAGYRNPAIGVVAFKATTILDLADYILSDLNRQKRHARLVPSVCQICNGLLEAGRLCGIRSCFFTK